MTPQTDPITITETIKAWEQWQQQGMNGSLLAFIAQQKKQAPLVVANPDPGPIGIKAATLAVFTSRAALRKAMVWFQDSRGWSDDDRKVYLLPMLNEMQDAISNCNTALYHLSTPDTAQIGDEQGVNRG